MYGRAHAGGDRTLIVDTRHRMRGRVTVALVVLILVAVGVAVRCRSSREPPLKDAATGDR